MNGKILIVGGYGGVGQFISTVLGDQFPGQVVVAGRNYQKAQDFAAETNNKVTPEKLDISNMDEVGSSLDDNVAFVVMCVENQDTRFAEQCINRGIDYVDISATYELLSRIEMLDSKAKEHGSTVLISVGLAPGLTNLLASQCKSVLRDIHNVDIFLFMGMGEVHGESSNQWVLDNLNSKYSVRQSGKERLVQSFGEYKKTVFPGDAGKRSAFRFNFSDQHTVVKTLGIDSASTWACFDSAFFTWFFYVEKKLGLLNLLRIPAVKKFYLKLFGSFHMGSDMFIVQAVADGHYEWKASFLHLLGQWTLGRTHHGLGFSRGCRASFYFHNAARCISY